MGGFVGGCLCLWVGDVWVGWVLGGVGCLFCDLIFACCWFVCVCVILIGVGLSWGLCWVVWLLGLWVDGFVTE